MKKNRLFLLISVLLVVAMLFSACGPKPADSTTPDATKAPDATETPAGDPVEEVLEPYTFTLYYNYDWWTLKEWAKDEVSKTLAEKFNITVEFSKPDADPKAKLNAMVAAKDLPDAIMMDSGPDNINLVTLGLLQPLEQYMASNPNYDDNILKTTQEMLKIDGKLYGIPNWSRKAASGGDDVWMYDDRIYTAAGRPEIKTFEDMYNYAMKVKTEQPTNKEGLSITPVQFPEDNAAGGWPEARAFYRSFGGNINGWFTVLDGKYQLVFRDPLFKESTMEINKWWRDGLISETQFTDSGEQVLEKIVAGRAGLLWYNHSFNEINKFRKILMESFPDDSYEIVQPFPYPPAKGLSTDDIYADFQPTVGGQDIYITTSAEQPQRIFDLYSYFLTPEAAILQMYGPQGDNWDELDANGLPMLKTPESEQTPEEINRLGLWFWMEPGQSDNIDLMKFAVNNALPVEKQNWVSSIQSNILTPLIWLTDEFVGIGNRIDPQGNDGINKTLVEDFIRATYPNVIMAKTQAEAEALYQSIIDFANDNGHQAVEDLMDADYQANVAKVGSGLRK